MFPSKAKDASVGVTATARVARTSYPARLFTDPYVIQIVNNQTNETLFAKVVKGPFPPERRIYISSMLKFPKRNTLSFQNQIFYMMPSGEVLVVLPVDETPLTPLKSPSGKSHTRYLFPNPTVPITRPSVITSINSTANDVEPLDSLSPGRGGAGSTPHPKSRAALVFAPEETVSPPNPDAATVYDIWQKDGVTYHRCRVSLLDLLKKSGKSATDLVIAPSR